MWFIYRMEYELVLKSMEIFIYVVIWMNFADMVFGDIRLFKKDK